MPPGFVDSVSSHPSFPPYFCYMYALTSPLRPEKGSLSEVLLINPFSQSVCRTALASDDDELQCNAVLYCRGSLIISPEASSSEEDESVRAEDTAPPVESRESMSLIERIYVAGCFLKVLYSLTFLQSSADGSLLYSIPPRTKVPSSLLKTRLTGAVVEPRLESVIWRVPSL